MKHDKFILIMLGGILGLMFGDRLFDACVRAKDRRDAPTELEAEITAYTPDDEPNPWKDGFTATGKDAAFPGCATCWDAIAKGSVVLVPGAGAFIVDDTGGACRRGWFEEKKVVIDIRLQSRDFALEWGRRKLIVTVWRP